MSDYHYRWRIRDMRGKRTVFLLYAFAPLRVARTVAHYWADKHSPDDRWKMETWDGAKWRSLNEPETAIINRFIRERRRANG